MKRILLFAALLLPLAARADTVFTATLNGAQDSVATSATGFGTVVLNAAQNMITVDESWTGLLAPATASHIHCCAAPGTNAAVLFPFSGVPNATSGSIPEQTFAITAAQVLSLEDGLMYFNVHDSLYPGGEIRGQILLAATPEPASLALLTLGLLCALLFARRTRRLQV